MKYCNWQCRLYVSTHSPVRRPLSGKRVTCQGQGQGQRSILRSNIEFFDFDVNIVGPKNQSIFDKLSNIIDRTVTAIYCI